MPQPEERSVPAWFAEALEQELRPWIALSSAQISRLYAHYELLQHWNTRISLTTVKPGIDTIRRHYCESIFFAIHVPVNGAPIRVADIGSGAGFPGIPMAIVRPEWTLR